MSAGGDPSYFGALSGTRSQWRLFFACAVAALFRLPLVSRAFASGFASRGQRLRLFLRQVDLDAAYQAGLLTRLDRTLTKDGLTLNIIDAGVDRDAIVVSFSILPAEEDPSGIWARMDRGEVMVAARIGDYGTATFMQPLNREENRIYGVARAAQPKGWRSLLQNLLGSKVTLSFSACEKEPLLRTAFRPGCLESRPHTSYVEDRGPDQDCRGRTHSHPHQQGTACRDNRRPDGADAVAYGRRVHHSKP